MDATVRPVTGDARTHLVVTSQRGSHQHRPLAGQRQPGGSALLGAARLAAFLAAEDQLVQGSGGSHGGSAQNDIRAEASTARPGSG